MNSNANYVPTRLAGGKVVWEAEGLPPKITSFSEFIAYSDREFYKQIKKHKRPIKNNRLYSHIIYFFITLSFFGIAAVILNFILLALNRG